MCQSCRVCHCLDDGMNQTEAVQDGGRADEISKVQPSSNMLEP